MKIVDAIPGRQTYPWGEWFDGQIRLLESGVDYSCEEEGLRSAAYAAAKKAGLKVVVRIRPEGVYVHALPVEAYTIKPATVGGDDQDGDDTSRRQVA